MKVTWREIDGFLQRPPESLAIALFFGHDQGLVSERAVLLSRVLVDDIGDPFAVTVLDGDAVSADPALLYDSAAEIPALGGRRLVRIGGVEDSISGAVESFLEHPPEASTVVMTSRDLNTRSKLVKLLESSPRGAAIGCYPDRSRQLADMIREVFSADSITVDREAVNWITDHLGGDRLVSRSEIEKLAILAGRGGHMSLSMAREALGDSAAIGASEIIRYAASGALEEFGTSFDRAMADAIAPEAVLRVGLSYFQRLFRLSLMMEEGLSASEAVNRYKPPIFFNEKPDVTRHLEHWHGRRALQAVERLAAAEAQARKGLDSATVTSQALLGLAAMARRS